MSEKYEITGMYEINNEHIHKNNVIIEGEKLLHVLTLAVIV